MTTPRDIDSDLADVSDAVLADLSAEDRTKLSVEAIASGREEHVDKLKAAAPRRTYEATDLEYASWMRDILLYAAMAWHELERGVWQFEQTRSRGRHKHFLDITHGDEWEWVEDPPEDDPFFEAAAMDAAAEFLADYHSWEQFADEILDVDLTSFLAIATPDAWIERIENVRRLADGSDSRSYEELLEDEDHVDPHPDYEPGWGTGRTVSVDGEELPIDEAAERRAAKLLAFWDKHRGATGSFAGN